MTAYYFEFDPQKNRQLQRERGISFEQVIALIESGHLVGMRSHHNRARYSHQHIIEVGVGAYVFLVPCVITGPKIFLKTIYPSRKATRERKETGDG